MKTFWILSIILVPFLTSAITDLIPNPTDRTQALFNSASCQTENGYDFSNKAQGYCSIQKYALQIASNPQKKMKDTVLLSEITQKEQQEWIRLVHNYKIDSIELLKLKLDLRTHEKFMALSKQSQSDIESTFYDAIKVSERMEEYRRGETVEYPGVKMYCRFALQNNPYDELPRNSIFINPQSAARVQSLLPNSMGRLISDEKATIGFCWILP